MVYITKDIMQFQNRQNFLSEFKQKVNFKNITILRFRMYNFGEKKKLKSTN